MAQFFSAGATLLCLFITGISVWTLLTGLLAAAFTKANLAFTRIQPMSDQEADAMMGVARYVLDGAHSRTPSKH